MSQEKVLKEIKKRITQSVSQGQLIQLELDSICIGSFTKQMKALIQQYPRIEYLTLNDCQMIKLTNFPYLPNLSILELSNNQYILIKIGRIEDDELFHLLRNSHISHLMIDENKLRSIEKVSILRQLPNLQQLEIAGNRIGDSEFYREELFERIPQLKIIDCHDKKGNIAIQSESESEDSDNSMIEVNAKGKQGSFEQKTNKIINIEKPLLNLLQIENQESNEPISEQNNENKTPQEDECDESSDVDEMVPNRKIKKIKPNEETNRHCKIFQKRTEVVDSSDSAYSVQEQFSKKFLN